MLEEIDASQFTEWLAYEQIHAEEYKRETLKAKAEAGVDNHKRRGR